jgi:heme oxygenase (mycobilin-producing)
VSVVKINAITVRQGSGDELARRFAQRAGAVDDADGFEGFELFQPNDGRDLWLVVTRWRDEASFEAWVSSPAFAHGHRREVERPRQASAGDETGAGAEPPPVGAHSELWSYDIVDLPGRP